MWTDGENPGAGSQSVDNTGLNGNWQKLDLAVGTEHNPNGTHKSDVITGANLKNTIVDGSTLEASAATGAKAFRVKDLGITSAKIAANAVIAGKLADGGVDTTARIADNIISTAKIIDGAITSLKIGANAVVAGKLADGAVDTAARIADAIITGAKLVNGTITSTQLGIASVIAGKLASGAIDAAAIIANNVIQSSHFLAGAVNAAALGTDAVETVKIKDANVTTAKLEYKEYVCTVSQTGTSNPVGNLIKNTIGGTPTWTRLASPGLYKLTFTAGALTLSKTVMLITNSDNGAKNVVFCSITTDYVFVNTVNSTWAYADGLLSEASIIIRVYP